MNAERCNRCQNTGFGIAKNDKEEFEARCWVCGNRMWIFKELTQ